jgi:anti-sigma factor RsiW
MWQPVYHLYNMFRLRPQMCERAREWASLRLDGELSELERALLDAHARRCGACAQYVEEIGAITASLRSAEREELPRPVSLPLRRSFAWATRALQAGAATAAVLAITAGLSLQVGRSSSSHASVPGRLPANAIQSGPNTESDQLIRAPKLATIKGEFGIGRQRGLRIDT